MISEKTLGRLPLYANYLRSLPREAQHVSATSIASGLGLHQVQVRKDLASICSEGRPRIGYCKKTLLQAIERHLWKKKRIDIVLAGAGNLGRALLLYPGFFHMGFHIVAAFDKDEKLVGSRMGAHIVRDIEELSPFCLERDIRMGIITAPAEDAQPICDMLLNGGVKGIWNFAPVHLNVPEHVQVANENIAASLAILARRLEETMQEERSGGTGR